MQYRKVYFIIGALAMMSMYWLPASATPRIAAKYGQFCFLCHQDPGGSGMRTGFGSQFFSMQDLPMTDSNAILEEWPFDTEITDNITIGGDFRALSYYSEELEIADIMTMQGNLYVNVQPFPKFALLYKNALRARDDIWAIGYVLPWKGYVRTGTFTPNFGIQFADHTAYVRERLGFALNTIRGKPDFVPGLQDTGVSAGIYPGPFHLDCGIYNGSPSFRELDKDKAFSSRLAYRQSIGELNLILGSSYYQNKLFGTFGEIFGGFTMIGIRDFAFLAEIDQISSNPEGLPNSTEMAMSFDAAYFIIKGLDLRARYDIFLPQDNSLLQEWKSITAGVDIFPYFFLKSTVNYRYHSVENVDNFSDVDVQLHFWF
jgi:hypothetical protein